MKTTQLRNSLFLLLTAVIWGTAFVAQSVGMDYVDAFTFSCSRSILGGMVLIPLILVMKNRKQEKESVSAGSGRWVSKAELLGGVCCGIALFAASNFQQFGIKYTTVGKAGFITALYVVIVPVLGLFLGKKVSKIIWFCVAASVIGLYLLCMTGDSLRLSLGDLLVLICAFLFSIHIMVIDYFSPKGDGVVISCIQFFVCGILSGIMMFLFEEPQMSDILAAKIPILYAGVMSSGVAYTLQIVGQKDMNPAVASLILCLESVVSALAGWLILKQSLSARELFGCMLMFAAIVVAELKNQNE